MQRLRYETSDKLQKSLHRVMKKCVCRICGKRFLVGSKSPEQVTVAIGYDGVEDIRHTNPIDCVSRIGFLGWKLEDLEEKNKQLEHQLNLCEAKLSEMDET